MALIATLVIGSNGASTINGSSAPLSTPADRERFLALHRRAGAYIIGRKSAEIESYAKSSQPIYIFSRSTEQLSFPHPHMKQILILDGSAGDNLVKVSRAIDDETNGDVVIEAGSSLLMAMVRSGALDELELTITPIAGDGDFLDLADLLRYFEIISEENIEGTRLLKCRYQGNASNG